MKYFSCSLLMIFFMTIALGLNAQELSKSLASQTPSVVSALELDPNSLPAKQVSLLYEVIDIEATDMADDPDNPEVAFQEDKLAGQVFDLNILLQLFSTGNIAAIHARIGTSPEASDHAQYRFNFDQTEGLPAPFTFARDGKTVILGMGQVQGLTRLYVEVVLEGMDGKLSEPRYYSPD